MATLTEEQKRRFVRDGFVHVGGAVPPRLVMRARRAINHSIGTGMDRDDLTRFSNQSFCTELVDDPRLLRLATTPTVWSRVRALLGDRRTLRPQRCQIALRFPLPEAPHSRVRYLAFARHRRVPLAARRLRPKATPTSHGTTADVRCALSGICTVRGTPRKVGGGHIDGYHTPDNGVPDDGVVRNFTLLLGVMLSDVREPFSGNFTVWPGTHYRMQRYFRDRGVNSLQGGAVGGLGLGMPKPVHVLGQAGDIVLAHYQVAHTAAPNLSGDIRYMCFFRLSVRNLGSHRVASMLDIWRDWPALGDVIGSGNGS